MSLVNFDDLIDNGDLQGLIVTEPEPEPKPIDPDDTSEPEPSSDPIIDTDSIPPSTEEVPPKPDDEDDSTVSKFVEGSYELLKEYGILNVPDDFEFDGKPESLMAALEKTKESLKDTVGQEFWQALPDKFKPLLQYAMAGGTDLEAFLDAHTQPDYSEIDLSDEDNQRRVMFDYWSLTSNYSPEKINRMIDALEKAGDLESEAQETAQELSQIIQERQEALIKEAQEREERQKQIIQEQTEKLSKTIKELPNADQARKNRIQTFMFTPVKYENGYATGLQKTISQITSNPQHYVELASLLADYHPDKGFNYERFKAQVRTEETKNFKDIITKVESKTKVKGDTSNPKTDSFDFEKWLKN